MFSWLPVESIIHDRQEEYYLAINESNYQAASTPFIVFMLSAIRQALEEAAQTVQAEGSVPQLRQLSIEGYLKQHGTITNHAVCTMLQVSGSTANRILSEMVREGRLQKIRLGRTWAYKLP